MEMHARDSIMMTRKGHHIKKVRTIGSILLAVRTLVLRTVEIHFAFGLQFEISVKASVVIRSRTP